MKAKTIGSENVESDSPAAPDHDAIIIGAGLAGICSAVKLDEAGFGWIILERQESLGGTWWQNRYPGVGVDTATQGYCYSFAQEMEWSRTYPSGPEIVDYLEYVAKRFGLRDRIRFKTEVLSASWDDERALWTVTLVGGEQLTARHLVGAWGIYARVNNTPDIAGLEEFAGERFHTAHWPEGVDLRGRTVAVIGTGASAVQLVPAIAPVVEHLTVFQRTAVWVTPRPDFAIPPRARRFLARFVPVRATLRWGLAAFSEAVFGIAVTTSGLLRWMVGLWGLLGRLWLRHQVKDPQIRRQLQPHYGYGCKRPTLSNTYFATYNRPNVTLVTDGIDWITPRGVRTVDGTEHAVDVLILGTGFNLWAPGCTPPITVTGKTGEDLGVRWATRGYRTYRGVSVSGYPNLWITGWAPQALAGPSYTFMVESNVTHMMRCLTAARRRGADSVEPRQQTFEHWSSKMAKRTRSTAILRPACRDSNSFWIDPRGESPVFRPSVSVDMWLTTRLFPLSDYDFRSATLAQQSPTRTPAART